MTRLFETNGDDLDLGYVNLRAGRGLAEQDIVHALETMWVRYEPYADQDFVQGFARDPEARFWEMFVGCAFLDQDKTLLRTLDRPPNGGRPDLCILDGQQRIWVEAMAPDRGLPGNDQVPEIVPINEGGGVQARPVRQMQLRITSALRKKSEVLTRYLNQGVIEDNDICLLAIGAARFGIYAGDAGLPLALSAVFPIGDEFIRVDRDNLHVIERGFHGSFEIERTGPHIPRTAFLDDQFCHVSGLIWSRISIGNMNRIERPLTLIHNPVARNPMPQGWGVWDREFIATQNGESWTVTDILAAPEIDPV